MTNRRYSDEVEDCRPDDEGCNPEQEPTKARAIKAAIGSVLSDCIRV